MQTQLARELAAYIEGLTLCQGRQAGQPFRLLRWERRFLSGAFGQPDDAALSIARANGKTTLTAAIACAALDGPLVEPNAESVIVAASFEQGLIAFRHALTFLRPAFEREPKRWRVQDSVNRASITDRETGAMLRVVGAKPSSMHGLAPALVIADECAQWMPTTIELERGLSMDQSYERHNLSVEMAWNAMLDLEKRYPLLYCWDVYTEQERQDMKNARNALAHAYTLIFDSYSLDSLTHQPPDNSIARVRPFLGEALYDIFVVHRVVVLRSAFALHRAVCEQSNQHWSEDILVRNALDGIADVDGRPSLNDLLQALKRLFCVVYAGVGNHTPSEKPKKIGFLAD